VAFRLRGNKKHRQPSQTHHRLSQNGLGMAGMIGRAREAMWRRRFSCLPVHSCLGLFVVFLIAHTSPAIAARLGGAYYVDDAEIGKLGSCEIESWASFAANGDRIGVFSPACVVNLGRPVELGTNIVGTRAAGDAGGTGSLTAKTVLLPLSQKSVGLAVAGAVVYDPINHTASGAILNVPISIDLSKVLRVNVNVGAQYNSGPHSWFATGGAGVSWNFVEHWSVISEMFAIVGPGQTNPRFQSGIRFSPNKNVDWDGPSMPF
jgi:hypothetical protein